ncbi:MAG: choice-of-anchor D domain-containing protein [Terriglobales bacterium]
MQLASLSGRFFRLFAIAACLLVAGTFLAGSEAVAQAPQPHYLAYATFSEPDPTQGYQAVPIAANGAGQVCAFNGRALLEINPDGTLTYFKAVNSIPTFQTGHSAIFLGMAIDSANNCYVTGAGTIVPTSGAYQSRKSSGMYLVKLDPQAKVVWATYLGGSGNDIPGGVALDPSGNIWVAGSTTSNDLPVTGNAIQSSFQGGSNDAFITELNATGTSLLYGTYLGGNGTDGNPMVSGTAGVALAIDGAGDVVVAGTTTSSNFPLRNPLETVGSAYVTKLSNAGELLYSTLFGLTSGARAVSVAVDPAGDASITGQADCGLPLVNPIPNQDIGAFVAKLSADGSALVYSTYYGAGGGGNCGGENVSGVIPFAIQVDPQGNTTISGTGGDIELVDPIQEYGFFLASLDPNGNLVFSSPFGSSISDGGQMALAVDSSGSVYLGTQGSLYYDAPPLLRAAYGTEGQAFYGFEGYIAKIAVGSGASFSMPSVVQFGGEDVGVEKGSLGVPLFNTGTTIIAINSITATGDFAVFQNQCPTMFNSAAYCTVFVAFTPTAGGVRNGTLVINDNSPGNPHIVQLTGTGLAPNVSVSPTSLTFPSQGLNTTSPEQTATVTDTGTSGLSISQIAISGTNASDFAETNNCGLGLDAGKSCGVFVTFTPTALGTRNGTLSITDVAGVQTVTLTGRGSTSLGLGIPSGGSNSATVSAGGTAKYTLSIGGDGISGTATLTCTGVPTGATCTVPGSENVSATTASTFTASVTTTAPTSAAFRNKSSSLGWMWATALIGVFLIPVGDRSRRVGKRTRAMLPLLLLMFIASCGGGNGGGGGSGSGGTPAGTYNLTVTATMGSTNQTQTLKLTVN